MWGSFRVEPTGPGLFLALEVKRDEKQKPSEDQLAFVAMVRRMGGVAEVVWSVRQALLVVDWAHCMDVGEAWKCAEWDRVLG